MAAPEKKIIAPWIVAAVMALLFVGTLATVVGNLAAGYTEMAQYARQLEGYSGQCRRKTRQADLIGMPGNIKATKRGCKKL